MPKLDYIFRRDGDEVEIWTPDESGACIGAGKSERLAIKSAIATLLGTIGPLQQDSYESWVRDGAPSKKKQKKGKQ